MSKFWQKKYISKHTGAEIDEAVEAVLDGDVGTTVVANPTLAGTEAALTGLQVDETKYKVTNVVANPTLAGTEPSLTGIEVGGNKYAVSGMTQGEADLRYVQLSGGLPYTTTAPSSANNDGIKIVVLSSEPATKYNGYLYIITA